VTAARRRVVVVVAAIGIILLIYAGDILVRENLRLGMFYLVPVLLATWFEGTLWGGICVVATVVLRMTLETTQGTSLSMSFFHQTPFVVVAGIAMFGFRHMRRTQDELQRLATHDHLTNVLNSSSFARRVAQELPRARRYHRPGALIYLDLDDFKGLNDTHGHPSGDAVLRLVADSLLHAVREVDVVGRMGGDEFAVLMPETDAQFAASTAQRLNDSLRKAFDGSTAVTASMGVVSFSNTPASAEDLLRRADQAMYEAKRAGKDRVVHVAV
jgi:diguanylate cyclase (GGDEF)-like protein